MTALLAALLLARVHQGLCIKNWARLIMFAALGWWLLIDSAQALPRGWLELPAAGGRAELELEPPPNAAMEQRK